MTKKGFNILAIVVGILAAWVISGCTSVPAQVMSSVHQQYSDDQCYPQMFTEGVIDQIPMTEREFNLVVIGGYLDGFGGEIIWVRFNKTGKCEASLRIPGRQSALVTCGEAYKLYLIACESVGNCAELI
jgi:hypothetical protein